MLRAAGRRLSFQHCVTAYPSRGQVAACQRAPDARRYGHGLVCDVGITLCASSRRAAWSMRSVSPPVEQRGRRRDAESDRSVVSREQRLRAAVDGEKRSARLRARFGLADGDQAERVRDWLMSTGAIPVTAAVFGLLLYLIVSLVAGLAGP